MSVLQQAPNIEVLSLSVNKISSLRHFVFCSQLKQLYLRANAVNDLAELRCAAQSGYAQHLALNYALLLTALDSSLAGAPADVQRDALCVPKILVQR